MKHFYYPLLSFVCSALFVGCSESEFDTTRTPSLHSRYLSVSSQSLNFAAEGATQTLNISSINTPWTVSVPQSWVQVSATSGSTDQTLSFTASENESADTSRVCIATIASDVSDWTRSYPITLTQMKATPYITLNSPTLTLDGKAQSSKISLASNVSYNATSSASWLKVTSHNFTDLNFSVDENNTDNARSGVITLSASNITSTLSVHQRPANITSTTATLSYAKDGGSQRISVESEAKWTSTASEWISVSPSSGSAGTTTVTITVPKNSSTSSRSGFVYLFINGSSRVEIPVEQEGIYLTIVPQKLSFESFGGIQTLVLNSNEDWQVTSYPEWISMNHTSGSGDASLTASASENNTTKPRTGTIQIQTTNGLVTHNITVTQNGKYVDFSVPTLSFSFGGGSGSIAINTDGNWTISENLSWITLDQTSGSGSATVTVSCAENNSSSERDGEITIQIVDKSYTVAVHQDCKYLSISSDAFTFDSQMGYVKLTVSSNTDWTAKVQNSPGWIVCTPTSGKGNAEITIGVSENNTTETRTGVVEIVIPGVNTYLISVTQKGKYLHAKSSSLTFPSGDGKTQTQYLEIETDGTYEVTSNVSWINCEATPNTKVNGNPTVRIDVKPNYYPDSRNGNVHVSLTGLTSGMAYLPIVISQDGATVVDLTSVFFTKSEGAAVVNFIGQGTLDRVKKEGGSWLGIKKEGNAIGVLALEENTTGIPRSGSITLYVTAPDGGSYEYTIPVTQSNLSSVKKESTKFAVRLK